MPKQIIISESQYNRLFEARMDGFRLDVLRDLPFSKKVKYCKEWLGDPIGNGTSRMVFQLDDYSCLKLAKNQKGIAQNEAEIQNENDYYAKQLGLFPNVLNGTDEENALWVISEYVLPAKEQDFERVCGFPWETVCRFIATVGNKRNKNYFPKMTFEEELQVLDIDGQYSYLLHRLEDYIGNYDMPIRDLMALRNWGMCNREDGPEMVVLDSGLTNDVGYSYYMRQ